jgi:hypothetical protein
MQACTAGLLLFLISQAPHHEDIWGSALRAPPFLTSALDGGEWANVSMYVCVLLGSGGLLLCSGGVFFGVSPFWSVTMAAAQQ